MIGKQSTLNDLKKLEAMITAASGEGANYVTVAGVIRYYESLGKWDLIQNQDGGHEPINVLSVDSTATHITINFDTASFPNLEVGSFIIAPDETLALDGITCGSSVNTNLANIFVSHVSPVSNVVRFSTGTTFTTEKGAHSAVWDSVTNRLVVSIASASKADFLTYESYPSITSKGGYMPVIDTVGGSGEIYVKFLDSAGNQVVTPSSACDFFINDPRIRNQVNPNNFADRYGNLWFIGHMKIVE